MLYKYHTSVTPHRPPPHPTPPHSPPPPAHPTPPHAPIPSLVHPLTPPLLTLPRLAPTLLHHYTPPHPTRSSIPDPLPFPPPGRTRPPFTSPYPPPSPESVWKAFLLLRKDECNFFRDVAPPMAQEIRRIMISMVRYERVAYQAQWGHIIGGCQAK